MLNWFKKKQKTEVTNPATVQNVNIKPLDYHPKVILAWAKAIDGNKNLLLWLKDNDFMELAMATHAIYLREEARKWLIDSGYPHLMAMINAAEGNKPAQKWLLLHDYEILYHMALAIESEDESWEWLGKNVTPDIFLLTQSIKKAKDQIEEGHNDVHTFGKIT
ncbi:MAG: hypothetical protein RL679_556 [Bacteroidota bacterium]